MKKVLTIIVFMTASILLPSLKAQPSETDRILGVWVPGHGNARVEIARDGDTYFGTIVWLRNPVDPETGSPRTNSMSPDEDRRDEPLLGLRMVDGFHYSGDGIWEEGTVYDPEKGKSYCGKITLLDDSHLKLRGNICGFSLFGRNDTWTRYAGDQ